MIRNEIVSWALKLWLICVIGFTLFCLGRSLKHFPKHEREVSLSVPVSPSQSVTIPVYEAARTAVNQYEILRRVQ